MRVLVTGGAGSIGSAVVKRLIADGHEAVAFDINEEALWRLQLELPEAEIFPGDILFPRDIESAACDSEGIVHCAAMKHIHLCEGNPPMARRVNECGSQNVALTTAKFDQRLVFVSTDKAIQAVSVMGRTKKNAERICRETTDYQCNIVRFGNVIGSRGSLVPTVMRYRDLGRPIPLTDARMTRFFMSIDEAVGLIFTALFCDYRGQVMHPDKPRSAYVKHFIEVCRDLYAPGVEIVETETRPGERVHEYLYSGGLRLMSNDPRCLMKRDEIEDLLVMSETAEVRERMLA